MALCRLGFSREFDAASFRSASFRAQPDTQSSEHGVVATDKDGNPKHKSFTVATKVNVSFCDPQSPWQRGTNENTNGLLRQYFPKKTDLSVYAQSALDKVALRLNQRPRKTFGFQTPATKLQASVASIG